MADVIHLDYRAMEEMAKHCSSVASRLEQTASFVQETTQMLRAGVMIGVAGDTFAEAQSILVSQTRQISENFKEMSKGIQAAIADMQAQDH